MEMAAALVPLPHHIQLRVTPIVRIHSRSLDFRVTLDKRNTGAALTSPRRSTKKGNSRGPKELLRLTQVARLAHDGLVCRVPPSQLLLSVIEHVARVLAPVEARVLVAGDDRRVVQHVEDAPGVLGQEGLFLGALYVRGEVGVVGFFEFLSRLFMFSRVSWIVAASQGGLALRCLERSVEMLRR